VSPCPYCSTSADDVLGATDHAIALLASDPITPGHCIVAPRRHVGELFALDAGEQQEVWTLIAAIRNRIRAEVIIEVFHLGFSEFHDIDGHLHIHVVPQHSGAALHLPEQVEWVRNQ
jgi:diadenosine tetraphosphate (Ap4A) HIT family hydrolase